MCDSVTYTTTISWSSAVINDCHQTLPSAWRSQDWSSPWRPWQWWCWRPPCWPGPGPGTMTVYTPCSELPDSPQPIFTSRSWGKGNSHIIPSHESSKFLIQLLFFFTQKVILSWKDAKKNMKDSQLLIHFRKNRTPTPTTTTTQPLSSSTIPPLQPAIVPGKKVKFNTRRPRIMRMKPIKDQVRRPMTKKPLYPPRKNKSKYSIKFKNILHRSKMGRFQKYLKKQSYIFLWYNILSDMSVVCTILFIVFINVNT